MIWAEFQGKRIKAEPKIEEAHCSLCHSLVIPKCGVIKIWHWAHKNLEECDSWGEPETAWHINWKNEFPKEWQEIIVKQCTSDYCNNKKYHAPCNHINCVDCVFKNHRSDIKTSKGLVIEFQNSSISPETIIEREKFYKNMIWVINGKTFGKNLLMKTKDKNICTFRWKHPPKCWWYSNKPIYIDFSDIQEEQDKWIEGNDYMGYEGYWKHEADHMERDIFLIKKIYNRTPCGGWGILISKEQFLKELKREEIEVSS